MAHKYIIDRINDAAMSYIDNITSASEKLLKILPSKELKDITDTLNDEFSKAQLFLQDFESKTSAEKLEKLKDWEMDIPNELNPPDLTPLEKINTQLREIKDFYGLILSEAMAKQGNL